MADKDLYEVLGVSRSASADEIKRAYRKLAKQHHPDRNKGNRESETRFKEVQTAYDVLSEPAKRAQYDQFGSTGQIPENFWAQGGPGGGAGPGGARTYSWNSNGRQSTPDFDINDIFSGGGESSGVGSIFEELIGGRRGGRRRGKTPSPPPPVADLDHEVTLDFDQAIKGTTLELQIQLPGRRKQSETIQVRIPPGVAEGQRIRVRGKGPSGEDGSRGDLYIICRVRTHAYFRRDGNDIYLDLPLTIAEAALGGKVSIPTLDGTTVVTVPAGTASGKKLRLTGRGVLDARTNARGDQYALIKIVPPAKLSDEQRGLMEQLAATGLDNPREGIW